MTALGRVELRARGWSTAMIDELLPEPASATVSRGRRGAYRRHVWTVDVIEAAEAAPGFAERVRAAERGPSPPEPPERH